MALVPRSRRPPIADAALAKELAEDLREHPEGVADLGPFRSTLPSPAQLVAQALVGPRPTLLQQQYQSRIGVALTELARTAGALAAAANTLSPANGLNAFQQLGIESSDPETVDGYALSGAQPAVYRIGVSALAQMQQNAGLLLTRGARTRIPAGAHRVAIRTATGRVEATLQIDPSDTNEIALGELIRAVNDAHHGVSASLAEPTDATVQATAASQATGRAGAFDLQDAAGGGSIISLSGLNGVLQEACDASFTLNGVPIVNPENLVVLQGGAVHVQLKAPTGDREVSITVGPDRQAVGRAMAMLVGAVSAMAAAIAAAGDTLAEAFVSEFRTIIAGVAELGAPAGLRLEIEEGLGLDPDELRQALAQDPAGIRQLISGPDGVAQRLGQFANEVIGSPLSRFGAPNLIPQLPAPSSHPTPTALLASNTLSSLLYAQLLSQGLFINSTT